MYSVNYHRAASVADAAKLLGQGDAVLTPNAGLKALPGKPPHADLREDRFQLTGGVADLTVTAGGTTQHLLVETIPDTAPEVERIGALEVNARGTFNLTYRAKDDYGIASAEGVVEPLAHARALVPPPRRLRRRSRLFSDTSVLSSLNLISFYIFFI